MKNFFSFSLMVFFTILSFSAFATTYYLSSSSGNDNNSGTDPSSPWRTINKLNSFYNLRPGDNVLFKRGDTFYGGIVVNNSGSSGSAITYGAYGSGAKPIITGFTNITSWKSLGGNIWESTDAVSSLPYTNMVSVNGVNTAMGRYPNSTGPNTGYLSIASHSGSTSITADGSLGSNNWSGAGIVIRKNPYFIEKGTISSQSGNTLYYSDPNTYPVQDHFGFFIQNDPKTLDVDGEWYYNPSTKKLRIYSTSTPNNVQIASIDNLISINRKSYIVIDNIEFKGSNSDALYCANYGSNLTVQNCDISFAGLSAIWCIMPNSILQNNNISYINYMGIAGTQDNLTVQNNNINNIDMFEGMDQNLLSGAAIGVSGANSVVQYNKVQTVGYSAIKFGGPNTKVLHNFVSGFCYIKHDGGGIDMSARDRAKGSIIDGNIVLNGIGAGQGTPNPSSVDFGGIFIDAYGTGITISNNTVANMATSGIKLHGTNNIIVKNNTCYNNGGASWAKGGLQLLSASDYLIRYITIEGNIFFAKTPQQLSMYAYPPKSSLDDIKNFGSAKGNFYAKPIDSSSAIKVVNTDYDVSGWKNYSGQDANSHGSPKSITDLNDLRFEYNATSSSKTINLDANYIDVKNNSYNGSVTLAPYTSVVLIKAGAKQTSLLPAVNPNNTVNGIDYRYYEGDFSGVPDFSQLTPVKKGNVTNYDLSISNRAEKFAVSFNGYINVPSDGQYTFYTSSDDGTMLYIDNNLVVNNDGEHGVVEKSGTIGLQAGKHAISLGYIQRTGDASLNVSYSGPGISKQLIPSKAFFRVADELLPAVNPSNTVNGIAYKYYEGSDFSVVPDFSKLIPVKTGTVTNYDISAIPHRTELYAVNFTGFIDVPNDGQYTFYTSSDDGSLLYIDDQLVVNNDGLHSSREKSGSVGLKAGKHAITVGFTQQTGDNSLSVSYSGPGISKQAIPSVISYRIADGLLPAVNPSNIVNGIDYKYYEASDFTVVPDFSKLTPVKTGTVTHYDNLYIANRPQDFAVNFSGFIDVPADGQYTFYTSSDDGSKLYIDNQLVVNNDGEHSLRERSGTIGLKAGKHAISLGYFQRKVIASLSASYSGPGISKQFIPSTVCYRVATLNSQRKYTVSTGSETISDSLKLAVTSDDSKLTSLQVGVTAYPNPFANSINVTITGEAGPYNLLLIDALGRTLWVKKGTKSDGTYQQIINTSSIQKGIYFLRVIQNNKSSVIKLEK
ncbi:MAG: PA14 domain-containing protein [Ginsengibacter sp.]